MGNFQSIMKSEGYLPWDINHFPRDLSLDNPWFFFVKSE